jgi:DNA-binding protein
MKTNAKESQGKDVALKEAENFVRKVWRQLNQEVDEKTIQTVARKVSRAIPPYDEERLRT